MKRWLWLLILLIGCSTFSRANEGSVIMDYNRSELEAMNLQTLADLLRRLPMVSSYYSEVCQNNNFGAEDYTINAIYKNGLALFMDQNIPANLQAISLNDIDSICISLPHLYSGNKGQAGLIIELFSPAIHLKNSALNGRIGGNALGDWRASSSASFSNRKHSLAWHFSRYFENGILKEGNQRALDWNTFDLHQLNVRYRMQFLGNSTWDVDYGMQLFNGLDRSAVFTNTTRAQDQHLDDRSHRLRTRLKSQISKYHSIEVKGSLTSNSQYRFVNERDLYSGKSEISAVQDIGDSTKFHQVFLSTLLRKSDTSAMFDYAIGIIFSNFRDVNYKTINAIRLSYLDYTLSGKLLYRINSNNQLSVGIDYLSNTVLGNYILPRAYFQSRPSDELEFKLEYTSSAIYPSNEMIYYPAAQTRSLLENNLRLESGIYHLGHALIAVHKNDYTLKLGMMLGELRGASRANFENLTYVSTGGSQSMINYVQLAHRSEDFRFITTMALRGKKSFKESNDQFFFSPDASLLLGFTTFWDMQFNAIAKINGVDRWLVNEPEGLQQVELQGNQLIDLGLARNFSKGKIRLQIGVRNFLNNYALRFDQTNLETLYPTYSTPTQVFADRSRSFFAQLNVHLE